MYKKFKSFIRNENINLKEKIDVPSNITGLLVHTVINFGELFTFNSIIVRHYRTLPKK